MRTSTFLLFILLAGCGGKSTDEHAVAKGGPPAPGQPDTRQVIVAFGDSLTAGFGAEPGNAYPDFLQKQLDGKGLPYRVVNMGVSGDTTTDALQRLPSVLAEKAAIIVVEFGGNDGLRGLPVKTTAANLDKIVDALVKSGAKVILGGMTLPPNYGPEYIKPFEKIYTDLTAKYKVTLIPFFLQGVGGNDSLMQQDGIHPNTEGYRMVADTVFQTLQKVIR